MPLITAIADTTRAYVRVEINWADTPSVGYAKVTRVDSEGNCVPLRPYVCFDGDYLKLSCGHGIFWDTELPLDEAVYYITEGLDGPCLPAADPCAPCTPVTAQTPTITMPSDGSFFLGDPVRPCNDQEVPLCFTQPTGDPACVPGSGIFFASMGDEERPANSLIEEPTNSSLPILMSRQARGITSVLTLVTRTFADRDALIDLYSPGGPLLLRAPSSPSDYGIEDQYMAVDPLRTVRGLSDHRYPVRVNELPYTQVRRPAGPSQGVCGSRVQDVCDTWAELQADGFTWDDLIRGFAGPNPPAFRRWTAGANSVLSIGTWNAVNNGTRTWTSLEGGA